MSATRTRTGVRRVLDEAAAAIGVILLVALAAVAPLWAGLNGMRSDACSADCRYDLIGAGSGIIAAGPAVVLVATVVVLLARARRDRALSWICGLGLLAAFGTLALGDAVITSGLGR